MDQTNIRMQQLHGRTRVRWLTTSIYMLNAMPGVSPMCRKTTVTLSHSQRRDAAQRQPTLLSFSCGLLAARLIDSMVLAVQKRKSRLLHRLSRLRARCLHQTIVQKFSSTHWKPRVRLAHKGDPQHLR
jgi:hypothetical protein